MAYVQMWTSVRVVMEVVSRAAPTQWGASTATVLMGFCWEMTCLAVMVIFATFV